VLPRSGRTRRRGLRAEPGRGAWHQQPARDAREAVRLLLKLPSPGTPSENRPVGRGVSCEATGVTTAHMVVLVEGLSDQVAIEALPARQGRNLAAEGIAVVPMGGATNIRRHLHRLSPHATDVKLAGLFDAGAEKGIGRALEWAGFGTDLTRADLEVMG